MEEFAHKTWKNYFGWNMTLPGKEQGVKLSFGMHGLNNSASTYLNETTSNSTTNMLFFGLNLEVCGRPKFALNASSILWPENYAKVPLKKADSIRLSPQIDDDAIRPNPVTTPWTIEYKDLSITISFLDGVAWAYSDARESFSIIDVFAADPIASNGAPSNPFDALLGSVLRAYPLGADELAPKVFTVPYLLRAGLNNKTRAISFGSLCFSCRLVPPRLTHF